MVGDPNGDLIGISTSPHFRRPKVASHCRLRVERHCRQCELVGYRYQLVYPLFDLDHPGLMVLAQCVSLEQRRWPRQGDAHYCEFLER